MLYLNTLLNSFLSDLFNAVTWELNNNIGDYIDEC